MVNIKKIIKIISWIIIALLGIALLLNWQTIESPVIIHADLWGISLMVINLHLLFSI